MTAARRDIITGIITGSGAAALFIVASGYPVRDGQSVAVSPGFYPRLLAVILAILSIIQITTAIRTEMKNRSVGRGEEVQIPPIWKDRNTFKLFCITLGSLIVYPFLMHLAGFAVTGFLFLGVLIYTLSAEHRKGKPLIFVALITLAITVLTYLVFRLFLKIPFPTGIIGF